jgi:membrane fusion protein, multidrug efflux system
VADPALQEHRALSKRALIIPLVILGVAALLFFAIKTRWSSWNDDRAAQETDDAYVRADMTPLSTRISGTVRKMEVEDFQRVKAGQVLVDIDDDEYRALVEQAKAALAAQAALNNNQAAKRIQAAKIRTAETMVTQAEAAVGAARASIAATQPEVEQTALQRKRQEALMASKATTPQELQAAVADAEHFSGLLASKRADLERAQAALASSRAQVESEKTELTALDGRDALYRADIEAKRAAITVAEVNLAYTRITAPTNGAVGQRHVQEGQLVTPGMQMVDLVRGDPWVQANYLETQIRNMRKGDAVSIKIDAFPGVVLHGKVEEIAPASGSQFALLPPDNATGNYTKVPQRIPVKIALEPGHPLLDRLRPGMSTEVTVHASGKAVEGTANAEGPQP